MIARSRQYIKWGAKVFARVLVVSLLVAVAVGVLVQRTMMESEVATVAQVVSGGVRPGAVVLEGTVTYANDNNTFILSDGTGSVELSTCPVWWMRIDLHLGDIVTVVGEPMRNPSLTTRSDLTLSVYKIFKDGDTIVVRGRPGKPPWSSHPLHANRIGF